MHRRSLFPFLPNELIARKRKEDSRGEAILNRPDTPISRVKVERKINAGLEKYSGPWTDAERIHLLRRTTFSVQKKHLQVLQSLNLEDAVQFILTPELTPAPPINDYNTDSEQDPDVPLGQTWVFAPYSNNFEGRRITSLKVWWIHQILNQQASIHLKLLVFWHNLLATEFSGVFVGRFAYNHWMMLFNNAFGNFKTLVKELTVDPLMLFYLNGHYNSKSAPDENYGREVQELFCIGKGPNAQFTEGDVQMAAKILTGWKVDWNNGTTYFAAWDHDTSDKQFSAFYNDTLISGKAGLDGTKETDEFFDMIFDTNECAAYLARRLYQFFVFAELDDEIESMIISPLAQIIRDNNYDINEALETLFSSAHFYEEINRGAMIKSPVEFIMGTFRTFDVQFPQGISLRERYDTTLGVIWLTADQGMNLGDPPSVSGWPAYYQAPVYDRSWISTNTIALRALRTDSLIYWGFWTPAYLLNFDLLDFVDKLDDPENPNELIQECAFLLLGLDISQERKDNLKSVLLSGQTTDSYWTIAWLEYKADPDDEMKKSVVETRLKTFFRRFLQLQEYNLQ